MAQALFIVVINGMTLSGARNNRYTLPSQKHFLTNDRSLVKRLLTPQFKQCVGNLDHEHILSANAVIYSIEDFSLENKENASAEGLHRLRTHLFFTQVVMKSLWFVKDNSADLDTGFFEHPYPRKSSYIHRNVLASTILNARGKRQDTEFSSAEIQEAFSILSNYFEIETKPFEDCMREFDEGITTTRLERADYFISHARASNDLRLRIASYMSALEAIFATDNSELTHKLGERVAVFLSSSLVERKRIYDEIKLAYRVRSRTLHGEELSGKEQRQLEQIGISTDSCLREIMKKVIGSKDLQNLFSGTNEDLKDFFITQLFS